MNTQSLGEAGEALAAAHLERLGYRILARRYRTRHGEIDIVAADGREIVFVEVKARGAGGDPWQNLHAVKQDQVRRMAAAWLADVEDRPFAHRLRFDAIGVVLDAGGGLLRLEHLEDAW